MTAAGEGSAAPERPEKHNGTTCPDDGPQARGVWNDAASRSGRDFGQIFMAIKELLRCTVCLEHDAEANQCENGHLICRRCTHALQRGEHRATKSGTCPTCQVTLFPGLSRCLLATQLSAELPTLCMFFGLYCRQSELEHHDTDLRLVRPVRCKYDIFGCTWEGRADEAFSHERNCSFAKRSIREVASLVRGKLCQRSGEFNDNSNSWDEMVNLFKESPSGVFVCVREATLYQVTRKSRKRDFRFQGTTGQLSRTGKFNVTIEVVINFEELEFYYRTKFQNEFMGTKKFRLLAIHRDNLLIPIADRLRVPKLKHPHEWQKYHCHMSACAQKLLSLASGFGEESTASGSGNSVRLEYLVIFEDFHTAGLSRGDIPERNWALPASSTDSRLNEGHLATLAPGDSTRPDTNGEQADGGQEEGNTALGPVVNASRDRSSPISLDFVEDHPVFIDEMLEGVVVAMNEAANRDLQCEEIGRIVHVEEPPIAVVMRNNNALEESNEERSNLKCQDGSAGEVGGKCRSTSKERSADTHNTTAMEVEDSRAGEVHTFDGSPRVLRSGTRVMAARKKSPRRKLTEKRVSRVARRIGQTFNKLVPYLTRGHMWQNFEMTKYTKRKNHNSARFAKYAKRGQLRKPRKRKRKGVLIKPWSLTDSILPLLTSVAVCWSTMKRETLGLLERGQSVLKSFRAPRRETGFRDAVEMPILSRRVATTEWPLRSTTSDRETRSAGDAPGWLFPL